MTSLSIFSEKIFKFSIDELITNIRKMKSLEDLSIFLEEPTKILTFYLYACEENEKYKIFYIPKKSGGTRMICSPNKGLKRIQKKISILLQSIYSKTYRNSVHGFIKNKSIITNAKMHLNKKYIFNIDLKDFFPSIHFGRIKGVLMASPFKMTEQIAHLISNLCCYKKEGTNTGILPQGSPSSPIITNIICFKLDGDLQKLAKKNKCKYTRYADDLTFSTNQDPFPSDIAKVINLSPDNNSQKIPYIILTSDAALKNKNEILNTSPINKFFHIEPGALLERIINDNGFQVNESKTRLQSNRTRQEVTGIKVNTKPNVDRKYIRNIRATIHNLSVRTNDKRSVSRELIKKQLNRAKKLQILKGKIEYIGQVRGKSDFIYQKFLEEYERLH